MVEGLDEPGVIPEVTLPINMKILKHEQELDSKSTAIHAKLLAPSQISIHQFYRTAGDATVSYSTSSSDLVDEITANPSAYVILFPDENAVELKDLPAKEFASIRNVIVIDGTWSQAAAINRTDPYCRLRRIKISPNLKTVFWRYQDLGEHCLSTIEAIYYFMREFHAAQTDENAVYDGRFDDLLYFFSFFYHLIQRSYIKNPERKYTCRHRLDIERIYPPEMESPETSEADIKDDSMSENTEIVEEEPQNSLESEKEPTEVETVENDSEVFQLVEHEERTLGPHRAKAFILNSESNDWEEMATGICSPEPSEDGEVFAIRLRAEEDTTLVLFTAYFHKGQEIGVQNDTVLTWTTLDNDEAALSFESPIGCGEFWKLICRFYGKSFEEWKQKKLEGTNSSDVADSEGDISEEEEEEFEEHAGEMMKDEGFYDYLQESQSPLPKIEISLPQKPEISTLTEIEEGLSQAFEIPSLKREIVGIFYHYQYIPTLLEIFRHCEEFGMAEELGKLYRIFKFMFLLNSQDILVECMSEANYLSVAGILEHDPHTSDALVNVYRTFLSEGDRFKQLVPLNDENILKLIHQTFRLQYFKDVILAKILDEESSASFILLIRVNHMEIINSIDNNPEVLEVIRKLLQTVQMPLKDQLNVLKFFKEFLTIAKTVNLRKNLQIHQTAVVNDFMKFITRVLNIKPSNSDEGELEMIKESKLLAIGLFTNFIQHDAAQIRSYLIQNDLRHEKEMIPKNLLSTVIDMFTSPDTCSPIRWQLVSALKILLDTFNPATAAAALNMGNPQLNPQILTQALNQKSGEDFLNYFYPDYACRLLRPLIEFDNTARRLEVPAGDDSYFFKDNLSAAQSEILFHLGELVCSFISQHKYRIKYLVLRNMILQHTLLLFKCREKHLQLTGLRIIRATLAVEDEFYFRFFIQHRSMGALFSLYKASGGADCDNLVTSAILEIFEFIRVPRDSLKALVRHLATIYRTELESFGPASVFRGILETEDRIDRENSVVFFANSSQTSLQNNSDQEMSPRAEEEDYFSNIEEVEDAELSKEQEEDTEEEELVFVKSTLNSSNGDDDEDDPFENLVNSASPGSPTKKTKI